MAKSKTGLVAARNFVFNGRKLKRGDEFDPTELGVSDYKLGVLMRARRIRYGEINSPSEGKATKKIAKPKPELKRTVAEVYPRTDGLFDVVVDGHPINDEGLSEETANDKASKLNGD